MTFCMFMGLNWWICISRSADKWVWPPTMTFQSCRRFLGRKWGFSGQKRGIFTWLFRFYDYLSNYFRFFKYALLLLHKIPQFEQDISYFGKNWFLITSPLSSVWWGHFVNWKGGGMIFFFCVFFLVNFSVSRKFSNKNLEKFVYFQKSNRVSR